MIAAFFHHDGRGTGPAGDHVAGVIGEGRQAGERGRTMNGGRLESWLRCPCCARRAEYAAKTMRRRVASALAAAGLAALAGLCLSGGPSTPAHAAGTGQIALIAIAVAAAGAFAALQVIATSRHPRPATFADWRRWPHGYDPAAGTCRGDPPLTDRQPWTHDAACLRYVCR
jgi:hypothetical protein